MLKSRSDDDQVRGISTPYKPFNPSSASACADRAATQVEDAPDRQSHLLSVAWRLALANVAAVLSSGIVRIEAEKGLSFPDNVRRADMHQGAAGGQRLRTFADIERPRR